MRLQCPRRIRHDCQVVTSLVHVRRAGGVGGLGESRPRPPLFLFCALAVV